MKQLHLYAKNEEEYVINFEPKIIKTKQLQLEHENWGFHIKNVYLLLCCV